FPYSKINSFSSQRIKSLIENFRKILDSKEAFTKESDDFKATINTFLEKEITSLKKEDVVQADVQGIIDRTNKLQEDNFGKKQNLPIVFSEYLIKKLNFYINAFEGKAIETTPEIRQKVLANIPQFVYY